MKDIAILMALMTQFSTMGNGEGFWTSTAI
jgi:hypothetical protein